MRMTSMQRATAIILCLPAVLCAAAAGSQPLTADRAVQIALEKSTTIISARAGVLDAQSGVYSAYSGVLPRVSADITRGGSKSTNQTGTQLFGSVAVPTYQADTWNYTTTPQLTGSWAVINLSAIRQLSSARSSLKASQLNVEAARSLVAFQTRQQFYATVGSYHLANVADAALRLARDNQRRVRALFEVGSVSRSDLLSAEVQTANSQLDSLTARQLVVNQRIALAEALAIKETEMGELDTVLTAEPREFDEGALLGEASKARPDLKAADAELNAANMAVTAAKFAWLPYLTMSGAAQFSPKSEFTQKTFTAVGGDSVDYADAGGIVHRFPPTSPRTVIPVTTSGNNEADQVLAGRIGINWDIFSGLSTNARIAAARARQLRAEESRGSLFRNLEAEVHQALLSYREAVEKLAVAKSAYAAALENLKLTQQKYNVGSTTILDLNTAQVNLTRAAANQITALASIRVAEAQLNRVRGRTE
jgi:outer membrane protein TolC